MTEPRERFVPRTVLLGPPGAGKGTQAAKLAASRQAAHIATGDLFRAAVAEGTELGKKAKGYLSSGKLVPDDLVNELVDWRLRKPDAEKAFVFDGYPRTVPQAESLEKMLADRGQPLCVVMSLEVPDEALTERAAGRLVCRGCGTPYNSASAPPRTDGICDRCGQPLYRRDDDRPEVVRERLRVYHAQTRPLLQFYGARSLLRNIDAARPIDVVARELDRLFTKTSGARGDQPKVSEVTNPTASSTEPGPGSEPFNQEALRTSPKEGKE